MASAPFRFKKFELAQEGAAHGVGTDAVLLGAWADVIGANQILDIGTGTGIVALMLAQRTAQPLNTLQKEPVLFGVEIHTASARLAKHNFEASPWRDRLHLVESSIQSFSQVTDRRFDLIVSNPPFFSDLTVSPDAERRLGRHTASLSPCDLLDAVDRLLHSDGRFCVILPALEAQRLCELAVPLGLYWTKISYVRSRPQKPIERWLIEFRRNPYPFEKEAWTIYEYQGEARSEAYQLLTTDFYL